MKSAIGGLFLQQIAYWSLPGKDGKSKLRVERDGRLWLAKSVKDWTAEIVTTEHQCKKALARLAELGLVESRLFQFQGKPTKHFWLDQKRLAELVAADCVAQLEAADATKTNWCPSPKPIGDQHQNHLVTSANSYTETTTEITTEITVAPSGAGDKSEKLPEACEQPTASNVTTTTAWWTMKADEVLARRTAGKLDKADLLKGTNAAMMLWKQLMAGEYGGYQKAFTVAESSQMKQLASACKEQTAAVLHRVIPGWTAYAFEVRAQKGLSIVPEAPSIGFLLKYHDVAMQLIAKPVKVVEAAKTPLADVAQKMPPKQEQKTDVATADEVLALMKQYGMG